MSQYSVTESQPLGPFKLVTCNPATNTAKKIMGEALSRLSRRYTIFHAANAESMLLSSLINYYYPEQYLINVADLESLIPMIENIRPDILVCFCSCQEAAFLGLIPIPFKGVASIWKPLEQAKIQGAAKEVLPNPVTFAVPHDILVEQGPEAVKAFLEQRLPELITSLSASRGTKAAVHESSANS